MTDGLKIRAPKVQWPYEAITVDQILNEVDQLPHFKSLNLPYTGMRPILRAAGNQPCVVDTKMELGRVYHSHLGRLVKVPVAYYHDGKLLYITVRDDVDYLVYRSYHIDVKEKRFVALSANMGAWIETTVKPAPIGKHPKSAGTWMAYSANVDAKNNIKSISVHSLLLEGKTAHSDITIKAKLASIVQRPDGFVQYGVGKSNVSIYEDGEYHFRLPLGIMGKRCPDMVLDFNKDEVLDVQDLAMIYSVT